MAPKRQAKTSSRFNFCEWSQQAGLSASVKKILKDNDLCAVDCLQLMSPEDVESMQLPLGQKLRIKRALEKLGAPAFQEESKGSAAETVTRPGTEAIPPGPTDQEGQEMDTSAAGLMAAGKDLDTLLEGLDQARITTPSSTALPPEYDPRIHLTMKATEKKAEKIFNFLPERVKDRVQKFRRDRFVSSQGENGAVSISSRDIENYSITQAEWGAANLRLMNHLLQTGDLARHDVELYLAYTVQILEMVDIYEWSSILNFDTRYRELQAQHGFKWGDLRMATHSTLLVQKRQQPPGRHKTTGSSGSAYGPGKTEDCKKWLASGGTACPFGAACRYRHRPTEMAPTYVPTAPKNDRSQTHA